MIALQAARRALPALLAAVVISGCGPRAGTAASGPGLAPARVEVRIPARTEAASLLLYLPPGYERGGLWPAILYLHGGSHRGNDLERLKGYGIPRMLAEGRDLPFVVIAPQLPEGEIWTDTDFLVGLIDELGARYRIDPDRLYAVGMSMGARGAWYLAYRHPDRFAAIASVATFQPIVHWASSGRLRSVPVLAYHGEQDPLAPLAGIVALREALEAAGGESRLEVLPGRDHFIADVFEDPELYAWLLRHRRRPG
jgi:poly(3-hydroxybutyrate) depolymerase